jgi:protein-disulfide isomerase
MKQAVALAKTGKSAADIQRELFGNSAPRAPAQAAKEGPPGTVPAGPVKKIEIPSDSPMRGSKTAKVTIVEWSDFECPFCERGFAVVKKVEQAYGGNVRLVFRHQPLPMHEHARPAAEASMAAHEQGKFWEYHDKLFAHQQALDRASLDKYAAELGLDMAKFKAALDSKKFDAQIAADATEATSAGVDGTPTFFINGRRLVGAQPIEQFKAIIQEELKKSSASLNELKKTAKK